MILGNDNNENFFLLQLFKLFFKNWPTPASFCSLPCFSSTNFTEKTVGRRQRDSNSDSRSRRQARWPLDHHHGLAVNNFALDQWKFTYYLLCEGKSQLKAGLRFDRFEFDQTGKSVGNFLCYFNQNQSNRCPAVEWYFPLWSDKSTQSTTWDLFAVWPDWTILKALGDKFSFKDSRSEPIWANLKPSLFKCNLLKNLRYLLFQLLWPIL